MLDCLRLVKQLSRSFEALRLRNLLREVGPVAQILFEGRYCVEMVSIHVVIVSDERMSLVQAHYLTWIGQPLDSHAIVRPS